MKIKKKTKMAELHPQKVYSLNFKIGLQPVCLYGENTKSLSVTQPYLQPCN